MTTPRCTEQKLRLRAVLELIEEKQAKAAELQKSAREATSAYMRAVSNAQEHQAVNAAVYQKHVHAATADRERALQAHQAAQNAHSVAAQSEANMRAEEAALVQSKIAFRKSELAFKEALRQVDLAKAKAAIAARETHESKLRMHTSQAAVSAARHALQSQLEDLNGQQHVFEEAATASQRAAQSAAKTSENSSDAVSGLARDAKEAKLVSEQHSSELIHINEQLRKLEEEARQWRELGANCREKATGQL